MDLNANSHLNIPVLPHERGTPRTDAAAREVDDSASLASSSLSTDLPLFDAFAESGSLPKRSDKTEVKPGSEEHGKTELPGAPSPHEESLSRVVLTERELCPSSPHYSPTSPRYSPTSPRYSPVPQLFVESRELVKDESVRTCVAGTGDALESVGRFPGVQGTVEIAHRDVRLENSLDEKERLSHSAGGPSSDVWSPKEGLPAEARESVIILRETIASPADERHAMENPSLRPMSDESGSFTEGPSADNSTYRPLSHLPSDELQRPDSLLVVPAAEPAVDPTHPTSASSSTSPSSSVQLPSPDASIYQIKWINFDPDASVPPLPVITQNKNGPCPLISLLNVLSLTGRLQLQTGVEYQSSENLMSQLADLILDSVPTPDKASSDVISNFQCNVQDALAVLPKLQTGLDVNVKFSGPRQYEFTEDTLVFDILDVPLVHGWIVEDSDPAREVVTKCATYNQLVEFIITAKQSSDEKTVEDVLRAEDWLERTSSQLTYGGLVALVECLKPDTPYVLFRNNHFSTVLKHNNEIYILVTDQGYANEPSCIWERISNIEGDTDFFDARFKVRDGIASPAGGDHVMEHTQTNQVSQEKQMELDMLLALSLQEQPDPSPTANAAPAAQAVVSSEVRSGSARPYESDYDLAKRLQEEENLALAAANVVSYPPLHPGARSPQTAQAAGSAKVNPWNNKLNTFAQRNQTTPTQESVLPPGVTESQSAHSFIEHQRENGPATRVLPQSVSTNLNPARESSSRQIAATSAAGSSHRNRPQPSSVSQSNNQRTSTTSSGSTAEKKCIVM